jgi:hypothetical protein
MRHDIPAWPTVNSRGFQIAPNSRADFGRSNESRQCLCTTGRPQSNADVVGAVVASEDPVIPVEQGPKGDNVIRGGGSTRKESTRIPVCSNDLLVVTDG